METQTDTRTSSTSLPEFMNSGAKPGCARHATGSFRNYIVETIDDAMRIAAPGTEGGALAGMVVSYWEQACALLNYGLLHEDLFFETSGEFFGVWEMAKAVVPQARDHWSNQEYLAHMEKAAQRYETWIETTFTWPHRRHARIHETDARAASEGSLRPASGAPSKVRRGQMQACKVTIDLRRNHEHGPRSGRHTQRRVHPDLRRQARRSGTSAVRILPDGRCITSRDRRSIRIASMRRRPAAGSGRSSSAPTTAARPGISRERRPGSRPRAGPPKAASNKFVYDASPETASRSPLTSGTTARSIPGSSSGCGISSLR